MNCLSTFLIANMWQWNDVWMVSSMCCAWMWRSTGKCCDYMLIWWLWCGVLNTIRLYSCVTTDSPYCPDSFKCCLDWKWTSYNTGSHFIVNSAAHGYWFHSDCEVCDENWFFCWELFIDLYIIESYSQYIQQQQLLNSKEKTQNHYNTQTKHATATVTQCYYIH